MLRLTFPLVAGVPVMDLLLSAAAPGRGPGAQRGANVTLRAVIDTGANRTCVDAAALRALGIQPQTVTTFRTASTGRAPVTTPVYDVSLVVPGPPPTALTPVARVAAIDLSWSRYKCLLGRDVLGICRFVYDGPAGRFELEM